MQLYRGLGVVCWWDMEDIPLLHRREQCQCMLVNKTRVLALYVTQSSNVKTKVLKGVQPSGSLPNTGSSQTRQEISAFDFIVWTKAKSWRCIPHQSCLFHVHIHTCSGYQDDDVAFGSTCSVRRKHLRHLIHDDKHRFNTKGSEIIF